ncbi:hypothetical protein KL938_002785 [Ogataea parapolymorpha]|nr:hypothetical protein KL938_002785 [Ogataea parapolymorpha]
MRLAVEWALSLVYMPAHTRHMQNQHQYCASRMPIRKMRPQFSEPESITCYCFQGLHNAYGAVQQSYRRFGAAIAGPKPPGCPPVLLTPELQVSPAA